MQLTDTKGRMHTITLETGRVFHTSKGAVAHDDLLPAGLEFCAKLAAGPTATYGRMKKNLNLGETATFAEVLDHEALMMRLSGLSADSREAVRAFVEKREPSFIGE